MKIVPQGYYNITYTLPRFRFCAEIDFTVTDGDHIRFLVIKISYSHGGKFRFCIGYEARYDCLGKSMTLSRAAAHNYVYQPVHTFDHEIFDMYIANYSIEALSKLHRSFSHPSAYKLANLLDKANPTAATNGNAPKMLTELMA